MTSPVNKPVVSISQSGECPRAMSARLLGRPEVLDPESVTRMRLAAKEGTRWEAFVLHDLAEDHGYTIVETPYCEACDRNGHHVELDIGSALLVGHIDGFAPPRIVEVKTMSRFQFARWKKDGFGAFRKYAFQVSLYMIAMNNAEAVYAVKNRDTGELDVRVITEPPFSQTEIVNYVSEALRSALKGEIADCPHTEQYPCGFCYLNLGEVPNVQRSTNPNVPTEVQISQAVVSWRNGKVKEAEAAELVDPAKELLMRYLQTTGQKGFKVDGIQVTMVGEGITKRLDTDAVKLELGERLAGFETETIRKGYVKITDEQGGQ